VYGFRANQVHLDFLGLPSLVSFAPIFVRFVWRFFMVANFHPR